MPIPWCVACLLSPILTSFLAWFFLIRKPGPKLPRRKAKSMLVLIDSNVALAKIPEPLREAFCDRYDLNPEEEGEILALDRIELAQFGLYHLTKDGYAPQETACCGRHANCGGSCGCAP